MSQINNDQLLAQMRLMQAAAKSEPAAAEPTANAAAEADGPGFGELLKQSIDKVNDLQQTSGDLKEAFQAGDPNVSISDVMIASEKAGLAFQTMTATRDKLLEAYQKIQNMQL